MKERASTLMSHKVTAGGASVKRGVCSSSAQKTRPVRGWAGVSNNGQQQYLTLRTDFKLECWRLSRESWGRAICQELLLRMPSQLLPAPVSCCRPCCTDLVTVVTDSGGGDNPTLSGEEDPNVAGVVPANTAKWGTYRQLVPGTEIVFQTWLWNPDMSPQQWA